MKRVMWCQF